MGGLEQNKACGPPHTKAKSTPTCPKNPIAVSIAIGAFQRPRGMCIKYAQMGVTPTASATTQSYDEDKIDGFYLNCIKPYIPVQLQSEFDSVECKLWVDWPDFFAWG